MRYFNLGGSHGLDINTNICMLCWKQSKQGRQTPNTLRSVSVKTVTPLKLFLFGKPILAFEDQIALSLITVNTE